MYHSTVIDCFGNNKTFPNPHITCSFKIIVKSVRLSFVHHYSTKQEKLFNLIKELKEGDGLGYRRISEILCHRGYKTVRSNKPILHNYVYCIYKNGKIRERRLNRPSQVELLDLRLRLKK